MRVPSDLFSRATVALGLALSAVALLFPTFGRAWNGQYRDVGRDFLLREAEPGSMTGIVVEQLLAELAAVWAIVALALLVRACLTPRQSGTQLPAPSSA